MKNKKIYLILLILPMLACYMSTPTQQATITPPAGATAPALSATAAAPIVYIPTPTGTASPACIVTAEKLNVRKEPEADVIAWLYSGELVTVLEDAPRGMWIHIRAGSVTGWIHKDFCK